MKHIDVGRFAWIDQTGDDLDHFGKNDCFAIRPFVSQGVRLNALEQLPRVLEVGFGVGAGAGEAVEGLIQNRNDPLLFFERGEGNRDFPHSTLVEFRNSHA